MSLFVVDEEKCGLCGACVAACPAGLIRITDAYPVPMPADGADEACFDCGHCVAVCPEAAFAHRSATPEHCLPIREEWRIGPQQVGQLMRARRSVRNYEKRPVARETLSELLDIARFAPSGCNTQPVHWLVIHDTDQVRHISTLVVDGLRHAIEQNPNSPVREVLARLVQAWDDGADVVARSAPHLVIAHGPQANPMAPHAGIIAQTYLELAASTFGLGACWMGLVDMTANTSAPLRQCLALPEGHIVLATLAVGHPEFEYARIPPRQALRVTWR